MLAGRTFAITLRYPQQEWDIRLPQGPSHGLRAHEKGLHPDWLAEDISLRHRLGDLAEDSAEPARANCFGLVLALALFDQIVDSVFESLNAIRLDVDDLEASLIGGPGGSGAQTEWIPQKTLYIRRLLRQVRWSFLPSEEISELQSGPFLGTSQAGLTWQLTDLCREADLAVHTVRDVLEQVEQVVALSTSLKTERLDQTINVLTITATVLLVPTLIAVMWGMNFDSVPGAGVPAGFWLAFLVLVIAGAFTAVAIRRYLHRKSKLMSSVPSCESTEETARAQRL